MDFQRRLKIGLANADKQISNVIDLNVFFNIVDWFTLWGSLEKLYNDQRSSSPVGQIRVGGRSSYVHQCPTHWVTCCLHRRPFFKVDVMKGDLQVGFMNEWKATSAPGVTYKSLQGSSPICADICAVCGDRATKYRYSHYGDYFKLFNHMWRNKVVSDSFQGTTSCFSCRAFFRRSLSKVKKFA